MVISENIVLTQLLFVECLDLSLTRCVKILNAAFLPSLTKCVKYSPWPSCWVWQDVWKYSLAFLLSFDKMYEILTLAFLLSLTRCVKYSPWLSCWVWQDVWKYSMRLSCWVWQDVWKYSPWLSCRVWQDVWKYSPWLSCRVWQDVWNTHLGFLAEFDKMPLQLLDGEDKVRDHLILLAPFDLKQQKPVSLRITRLPLSGFNMLSIPQSSVMGSHPIHKSTGWRETVWTTAVQQGVYRWFISMVLLRKGLHNSSPTRSLQVIHVNGATTEKVCTTAVQQGVYRWFMLMVLLQKRSAQQQSNKEFTGDSC